MHLSVQGHRFKGQYLVHLIGSHICSARKWQTQADRADVLTTKYDLRVKLRHYVTTLCLLFYHNTAVALSLCICFLTSFYPLNKSATGQIILDCLIVFLQSFSSDDQSRQEATLLRNITILKYCSFLNCYLMATYSTVTFPTIGGSEQRPTSITGCRLLQRIIAGKHNAHFT